jgi:hypothetical protein
VREGVVVSAKPAAAAPGKGPAAPAAEAK